MVLGLGLLAGAALGVAWAGASHGVERVHGDVERLGTAAAATASTAGVLLAVATLWATRRTPDDADDVG